MANVNLKINFTYIFKKFARYFKPVRILFFSLFAFYII